MLFNLTTSLKTLISGASILALAACGQIIVAAMNQTERTEFSVQGDRLLMSGEINSQTLGQFNRILTAHPNIKTLVELDVPGSLDDDTMIALGYRVRALGLNTHLTAKSKVYSGGVDLFLAGVQRTIEPGAVLGVHSWSDGQKQATDFPRGAPEHEMNRAYVETMLGSDAFYWFTLTAAPADDIHILMPSEIESFHLQTAQHH